MMLFVQTDPQSHDLRQHYSLEGLPKQDVVLHISMRQTDWV
jgi:hypothetical protein